MPDLGPLAPDWSPVEPVWASLGIRSYVSGEPEGDRLRVRYYLNAESALVVRAWFGPGAEGPPGCAHGGSLAALLDEAMGLAALLTGRAVVAARIEVDFRRMLPLGTVCTVETHVLEAAARKVRVRATVRDAEGGTVAEASGLFVDVGMEKMGLGAVGKVALG